MPTQPPAPPPDPFTLAYAAIWDALTASRDWQAAVQFGQQRKATQPPAPPVGNYVRFDQGQYQPGRAGVGNPSFGDFPQIVLLQSRLAIAPAANSVALGVVQSYPLMLTAQDWDVKRFNYLKWESVRALLAAGESLGLPHLVRTWDITNGTDTPHGSDDITAAVGTERKWASVLAVNVEMAIPLSAVAAGRIPTV